MSELTRDAGRSPTTSGVMVRSRNGHAQSSGSGYRCAAFAPVSNAG